MTSPAIIEAALNGGQSRVANPAVPLAPTEVAAEARRCADAGASVVHFHAQEADGGWLADVSWYAEAIGRVRDAAPGLLISVTSIRPASVGVATITALLGTLAAAPHTRPDLLSINLGHIVAWERASGTGGRRTAHFPNDYADIAALLAVCRAHRVTPELGVMDLGFLSNAVALRDDGLLPTSAWFLLELDSPAWGTGRQVAPATVANHDFLAAALREHFPRAAWAAHGVGLPGYAVVARALATGGHARVGFEDAVQLPDGGLAGSNAALVAWAVATARAAGREPATPAEARAIIVGGAVTAAPGENGA